MKYTFVKTFVLPNEKFKQQLLSDCKALFTFLPAFSDVIGVCAHIYKNMTWSLKFTYWFFACPIKPDQELANQRTLLMWAHIWLPRKKYLSYIR